MINRFKNQQTTQVLEEYLYIEYTINKLKRINITENCILITNTKKLAQPRIFIQTANFG